MDITPLLKLMVDKNASDLFFSTEAAPHIKIEGETLPVGKTVLAPGRVKEIAYRIMSDRQIADFEETLESNFAISVANVGRFRVNVFLQRGEVGMVMRQIKTDIPTVEELRLPPILDELIMLKSGLILVVGPTGSGKSTSLAAMIGHRNHNTTGHILTIEDPIEFLHQHGRCVVDQREVGVDTHSWENALKNAMREAPDVILIGEIRDQATMQYAMSYAETGHLVLATLHANNAKQTLERIVNFFPLQVHKQLMHDLSLQLRAIVAQRLVIGLDNRRLPAVEVLTGAPDIADRIHKGEIQDITKVIAENTLIGMQTFDQALFALYREGLIDQDEALKNADSRNDLSLRMRLEGTGEEAAEDLAPGGTPSEIKLTGY